MRPEILAILKDAPGILGILLVAGLFAAFTLRILRTSSAAYERHADRLEEVGREFREAITDRDQKYLAVQLQIVHRLEDLQAHWKTCPLAKRPDEA